MKHTVVIKGGRLYVDLQILPHPISGGDTHHTKVFKMPRAAAKWLAIMLRCNRQRAHMLGIKALDISPNYHKCLERYEYRIYRIFYLALSNNKTP